MFKAIKKHYGFWDAKPDYSAVTYDAVDLANITPSGIDDKIEYVKGIFQFEENRQSTIENKISQIIGQSGVVFSLAGLFIPLFFDKLDGIDLWKKVILISLFLIAIFFYLWSILKATQSYQINNYKYATGDPDTVINHKDEAQLKKVIVKDLIYSCKVGEISNNHKANKLLFANNAFKSGSITMGILLLFFCFFVFSYKPVTEITKMKITNLDSVITTNKNQMLLHLDSTQRINFNNVSSSIKELNNTIQKKEFITPTPEKKDK